ncbi:hypothetical protein FB565_000401 [Actinoplanes lutulentus]|uniref:Uncharacterized protein n=1 Tax=Actinoplanes lutulentus TaxID=1287878 RepID=A0A327ZQ86_9ACTN|nr:hypothetical protein [Actinoplanes lutulentus]MBB2940697.1 hypothetical protein [Actinoplanes lutulentus]RAK43008.1 hypothetical protein B0I29_101138 [Actinoplanes lutulentus]
MVARIFDLVDHGDRQVRVRQAELLVAAAHEWCAENLPDLLEARRATR